MDFLVIIIIKDLLFHGPKMFPPGVEPGIFCDQQEPEFLIILIL